MDAEKNNFQEMVIKPKRDILCSDWLQLETGKITNQDELTASAGPREHQQKFLFHLFHFSLIFLAGMKSQLRQANG